MPNEVALQANGQWLRFENPLDVIVAKQPNEVIAALGAVETAVSNHNLYAAGFISYEAAAAFDLVVHPSQDGLPLLWFGLFEKPTVSDHLPTPNFQLPINDYQFGEWRSSVTEAAYHAAIGHIKDQIAAGYTYQVNYTYQQRAEFEGSPLALFADLAQAQQAKYMAYIDTGSHAICSASPELFFRLDGDVLTSKPMKGTAVRGNTLADDKTNIAWLEQSEKNRAENVMIVDMIRNDMGRVAQIGSVQVPHLFEVERYPTLLQMTSTVRACTQASLTDIITAMFPCASVTGAPKVSTMRIINELEPEPRGVYTGAIGYIGPQRQAQFNVAIRTVVVDREQGTAEYGVGSGIVWDSEASGEYEECRVKTRVLTEERPSFSLLESILWTPEEGYYLLDAHLNRLRESAEYFGIELDETAVRRTLASGEWRLESDQSPIPNPQSPEKIRLHVAQDGTITVEAVPLSQGAMPEPIRIGLAVEPVDSDDIWLYHKTTQRQVYEQARASRPDCDEVILWNVRSEITEAGSSNVVIELEDQLWTPPVASGLLAGTFRNQLLATGRIQERIITVAEFQLSSRIFLINSVRGWQTADISPQTVPANNILAPF